MLDGLLKSKFYSKCKSSIKLTKTRVEMIKRKRESVQKHLRSDIADLLRNGLDAEAYGRAEGLLVELNKSACYNFVEQFCGSITDHLSLMNKLRECPEECKQAIPSLMFAAARFADLPDLRELRSIFAERYGNSLDAYVNQEFAEKLKAMPPTKDRKLQLLQEIAKEFGVHWDSKALKQKLFNPLASEQARSRTKNDDKYELPKSKDEPVKKINNEDAANKQHNVRVVAAPKRNQEKDLPSYGRKKVSDDRYKPHGGHNNGVDGGRLGNTPTKDTRVASFDQNCRQNNPNSERNVSEKKVNEKPFRRLVPPPYTKPKTGETEAIFEVTSSGSGAGGMGTNRLNGQVDGKDNYNRDASVGETKPKPRSVRSRCSQPRLGPDSIGSEKGDVVGKMNSNGMRQEASRPGLVSEVGCQWDEEERKIDNLLMHYSTKQSTNELKKVAKASIKPLPPHPRQTAMEAGNTTKNRTRDGPPARATSLRPEPTIPTETTTKGPARAASFQPDSGHVHPKLPDYDDFVSRLAALRGK